MEMEAILPLGEGAEEVSGWLGVVGERKSLPEAEEILDLLVVGLLANILDMNGGRHDDGG